MKRKSEVFIAWGFALAAFSALFFLAGIVAVLLIQSLPLFKTVSFTGFITGIHWYPTFDPPEFGILPLIAGSLTVAVGALMVSVPLGIGSALYINELAGARTRGFLKPIVEVLAAIPSIVFGFFGMMIVAPFLQNLLHIPTGQCAFTASVVLGIMAIPTVASIAEDALSVVPRAFKEASYALGADRWQTLTRVTLPAAGSGVSTAIILGMSRIVGETMTVLMVSGGAAVIPRSFFDPVRPMTSTIAAEMGEAAAGTPHFQALFAIGLILFLATLACNIAAEIIGKRYRLKLGQDR
jgi:phosphate transport system permease protein